METQVRSRAALPPDELTTRLQRELRGQLDLVADFADLCAYLTPASGDERSRMLIEIARSLYDETLCALEQRRPEA